MPRRIDMTATLESAPVPAIEGARQPRPQDNAQLAALLLSAYAGTIDCEEETMEQAVAEIERTVGGEYGPYMPKHSVVVERGHKIVSATLITGWRQRPFLAYSMTAPQFQKQGLAKACLLAAMASLHSAGHEKLSLVVTLANSHAHRLYENLGFVPGR